MIDKTTLDELSRRLADAVPTGLLGVRDELEKNFNAVLQGTLSRLNLVSREEFDVQRAVLERARTRLVELEARLSELEKRLPPA
ncbi:MULTISPECIES: accessory factor UbiK family protein [Methylococcus]|jgi:BMFP domain-containing protein YqiC|uniref:Ubiquinone biosynthesis accessory factor UbiK n=1 Tax=Methylococcus capsulatus TaxID=414 RepID=A0AA35V765_METCP|nr:accessory factor UbiK family protein [Methylococcus capsulatus]QXP91391.1 accessory factor UbiK family protein [Methylococcus capsulatus]CAI8849533.1 Ubiquinone biosynthesis accessory factor UbiK [Methylococcus capsulatus]